MALYLVSTDHCGYDEYDAFVIRAETAARAHEIARERTKRDGNFTSEASVEVVEIGTQGDEEIILGSFNAG